MCPTVYQISRHRSEHKVLTSSSSDISGSRDNIPNTREILSAISDDKSLAIFEAIAKTNDVGADSDTIRIKLSLTHRKYYHRLAALIQNGLIIRKDDNKKYILTSLGKVVHSNLLSIQCALANIWKFRAIDAVRISSNRVYESVDKIVNGLIEILIREEQIKEILKI